MSAEDRKIVFSVGPPGRYRPCFLFALSPNEAEYFQGQLRSACNGEKYDDWMKFSPNIKLSTTKEHEIGISVSMRDVMQCFFTLRPVDGLSLCDFLHKASRSF